MSAAQADIDAPAVGIIGGSGLYELLDGSTLVEVITPYGDPSSAIAVGRLGTTPVAFLARHGVDHSIPPHRVNHRANIWALASLGASAVIGSSAVGSLVPYIVPDTFVVPDQLVDRTRGGADTFFDGPLVQHLPFADPFDEGVRKALILALGAAGERFSASGTTVVIPGPRFSTRAESTMWRLLGGHIVNMTQYPEAALAAELNMRYASLSFVTDTDVGDSGEEPVTAEVVFERLSRARPRMIAVLTAAAAAVPIADATDAVVDRAAVSRVLAMRPVSS